ncbi:InlB B-repeat-containing protein [Myxococcota bacterium]|nr:InlB B-repeat-containing protein [Myxococcota bacterium]
MKKLLVLLLSVSFIAMLVSCGSEDGTSNTPTTTYSVTYDGNGHTGGSVPVDTTLYAEGDYFPIAYNNGNLEKTGFVFVAWNTQSDGDGTSYPPASGDIMMGDEYVVFYAEWSPVYGVTYDANGAEMGSVPVDTTFYAEGDYFLIMENTGNLEKNSFSFVGWNTQADGQGTHYNVDSQQEMGSSNVILYAEWSAEATYTVSYDGNTNDGGSAPIDGSYYLEGAPVIVLDSGTLTKASHTFVGWTLNAGGTGSVYGPGYTTTYTMGAVNVTFYAKWTALPTYTVTYDGNTNTGGSAPGSASYLDGDTVTVMGAGTLTKTDFSFVGWTLDAGGVGTVYGPGYTTTYTMGAANVTFYAKWTELPTYTVTYDANGGTGTSPYDSTNYFEGDSITVLEKNGDMSKGFHIFSGWTLNAEGTGTVYGPDYTTTYTMGDANITFYVKWTPITQVYYMMNCPGAGTHCTGTPPTDDIKYEDGDTLTVQGNGSSGLLHDPPVESGSASEEGFKFSGVWTLSASVPNNPGALTVYGPDDVATLTIDTSPGFLALYALWVDYEEGDTDPKGGLIVASKASFTNGWRYISSDRYDAAGTNAWIIGTYQTASLGGTSESFGAGYENSALIMENDTLNAYNDSAARTCFNNSNNSNFNILPAKDTLNLYMVNFVSELGLSNPYYDRSYWTSSEYNATTASTVGWLTNGTKVNASTSKSAGSRVRCIRRF